MLSLKRLLPGVLSRADGVLAMVSAASVLSLDITRILNRQRLGTHSKKTYHELSIWYEITLMRGSCLFIVYSFRAWTIYKRARGVSEASVIVRPWFVVSYITTSWASHTFCAILLMSRESPINNTGSIKGIPIRLMSSWHEQANLLNNSINKCAV